MFAGPTTDMQIRVSRQAEIFGPGRLELGIGNRQPQHELSQPAALALGEVGPERRPAADYSSGLVRQHVGTRGGFRLVDLVGGSPCA